MLTPELIQCAIVLISRAPLKGDEAVKCAETLQALTGFLNKLTEEQDGDDANNS